MKLFGWRLSRYRPPLRLKATVDGFLTRYGWYQCLHCDWEWRYDGGDEWFGPVIPPWDPALARFMSTDQLRAHASCFGRLRYRSHWTPANVPMPRDDVKEKGNQE